MDIYQHRRHNKNLLMVHLIFVTKYRKKIVLGDFRDAVKQYLFDTCVKNHWHVKRMETDQDHVYILLQYNPTDSITHIVSILKQHSTYLSWQQHSALLEQHYWKKHVLWSDSYFAASIGVVSQAVIEQYFENQG